MALPSSYFHTHTRTTVFCFTVLVMHTANGKTTVAATKSYGVKVVLHICMSVSVQLERTGTTSD